MKKNEQSHHPIGGWGVKRWLLFMRNLLMILFVSSVSLDANNLALAQKISVKVENTDLKTIIGIIEQQTKLGFLYNEQEVALLKKLNLNVKNMDVKGVLDILLDGTMLTYVINEETILISRKNSIGENTQQEAVTIVVKGRITDSKKNPLPGASVYVKGTTIGVATNTQGEYTISLREQKNLTLVYSFIGMATKEVVVKEQRVINVELQEDVSNLEEVRVIAYGKTTKREATGAMTSIKGDDLLSVPTANLSSLLQGRVAGMDVANMSGSPGSGGTATILRGYNALSREQRDFSSPLWVIDGVPISNQTSALTGTNALSEIDPEMVESIEVLKDAAATSMYGSRAAQRY